ncbi:MAG: methyltransferase domain-containing protein [Alphaproteobacteria bacterium]|nr:methyltransferase domain-containing protein [Alphaproteobacteria bacterium]
MSKGHRSGSAAAYRADRDNRTSYEVLFEFRGASYDRAMRLFPDARREEFLLPIGRSNLPPGATVADVPSHGGYLARYLPRGCRWLGHEPCAVFGHGAAGDDRGLLPLPWEDDAVDAALSVAGVHHVEDKVSLFRELARVVRPGGRFVLADVHEASDAARFLDGWVDAHNSTGHDGLFLGEHTLDELARAGWRVLSAERVGYHWRFASLEDMGEFCHGLFDLRASTPEETVRAIDEELGIDRLEDGVGMRWELYMVVAEPAAPLVD